MSLTPEERHARKLARDILRERIKSTGVEVRRLLEDMPGNLHVTHAQLARACDVTIGRIDKWVTGATMKRHTAELALEFLVAKCLDSPDENAINYGAAFDRMLKNLRAPIYKSQPTQMSESNSPAQQSWPKVSTDSSSGTIILYEALPTDAETKRIIESVLDHARPRFSITELRETDRAFVAESVPMGDGGTLCEGVAVVRSDGERGSYRSDTLVARYEEKRWKAVSPGVFRQVDLSTDPLAVPFMSIEERAIEAVLDAGFGIDPFQPVETVYNARIAAICAETECTAVPLRCDSCSWFNERTVPENGFTRPRRPSIVYHGDAIYVAMKLYKPFWKRSAWWWSRKMLQVSDGMQTCWRCLEKQGQVEW